MNGEGGGGGVVVCASLVARRSDADPVDRFRHFSVSVGLAARFPQEKKTVKLGKNPVKLSKTR